MKQPIFLSDVDSPVVRSWLQDFSFCCNDISQLSSEKAQQYELPTLSNLTITPSHCSFTVTAVNPLTLDKVVREVTASTRVFYDEQVHAVFNFPIGESYSDVSAVYTLSPCLFSFAIDSVNAADTSISFNVASPLTVQLIGTTLSITANSENADTNALGTPVVDEDGIITINGLHTDAGNIDITGVGSTEVSVNPVE